MSIAAYLKEIGRGKEGARSLNTDQAYDLFDQVLNQSVTDLEIGAFCLAMRIKGESTEELIGFLQSAHDHCAKLKTDRPVVVLPSYNGARKLPNLTPLLAQALAQQGFAVLVHGVSKDPARITTHEIFQALGWATVGPHDTVASQIDKAWRNNQPVFCPIERLSPRIATLLAVRQVVGLRNPGHTVVKLLQPVDSPCALQVVNYTHPEYLDAHQLLLERIQANAILMRGTEGEPVADPRRLPSMRIFLQGKMHADLSRAPQSGSLQEVPTLPPGADISQTVAYVESILIRQTQALPEPIQLQVQSLISMRLHLQQQQDA